MSHVPTAAFIALAVFTGITVIGLLCFCCWLHTRITRQERHYEENLALRSHRTTPMPSFEVSLRERMNTLERNQKTTANLLKDCKEMLSKGPTFDDYEQAMQRAMEKDAKIAELANRLEEAMSRHKTSSPTISASLQSIRAYLQSEKEVLTSADKKHPYKSAAHVEFDKGVKERESRIEQSRAASNFEERVTALASAIPTIDECLQLQQKVVEQHGGIDNISKKTTESESKLKWQNRQVNLVLDHNTDKKPKEPAPRSTISELKQTSGVFGGLASRINKAVSFKEKNY